METMRWSEPNVSSKDSQPAPTIKNHSVTQFNGFLYCFGTYHWLVGWLVVSYLSLCVCCV